MSFDDVAIVTITKNDHRINFLVVTKGEVIRRMKN